MRVFTFQFRHMVRTRLFLGIEGSYPCSQTRGYACYERQVCSIRIQVTPAMRISCGGAFPFLYQVYACKQLRYNTIQWPKMGGPDQSF